MMPDARDDERGEAFDELLRLLDVDAANACSLAARRRIDLRVDENGDLLLTSSLTNSPRTIIDWRRVGANAAHWNWTPREITLYDRHKGRQLTKMLVKMQERLASAMNIPQTILFAPPIFERASEAPATIRYPSMFLGSRRALTFIDGI